MTDCACHIHSPLGNAKVHEHVCAACGGDEKCRRCESRRLNEVSERSHEYADWMPQVSVAPVLGRLRHGRSAV